MSLKHIYENCLRDLYVCWSLSDKYYWVLLEMECRKGILKVIF